MRNPLSTNSVLSFYFQIKRYHKQIAQRFTKLIFKLFLFRLFRKDIDWDDLELTPKKYGDIMLELNQKARDKQNPKTAIDPEDLVKIYKCFDYENLTKNADLLIKKIEFDLRCNPGQLLENIELFLPLRNRTIYCTASPPLFLCPRPHFKMTRIVIRINFIYFLQC